MIVVSLALQNYSEDDAEEISPNPKSSAQRLQGIPISHNLYQAHANAMRIFKAIDDKDHHLVMQ